MEFKKRTVILMRKLNTKTKITSKENMNAAKRLLSVIFKRHKWKLLFASLMVIISSLATISVSIFMRILIDDYIIPLTQTPNPDFGPLLATIIKMGSFLILGVLSSFLYSRMMVTVSETTILEVRQDMFNHMQSLPVSYFDSKSHGNIMSYYTNDVRAMGQMIASSFPSFVQSTMTIIMVLVTMFVQSVTLSLVVILTITLTFIMINVIGGKSSHYFLTQQNSLAKTTGYIEEMIDGLKVVKVFNREDKTLDEFDDINTELAENTTIANRLSLYLYPLTFAIANLQYILFAIFGGLMALSDKYAITVGIVVSFLQLSKTLSGPLSQLAGNINQVVLALAGSRRVFEFLGEEVEKDSGVYEKISKDENGEKVYYWHNEETGEDVKIKGEIHFENVDFSYDGKNLVLKNINLYAKPGQKIAFVGATGAGKTTITNLINRFYDIDSGKITFDGIDIKKIKKPALRSVLGMVLQDTTCSLELSQKI